MANFTTEAAVREKFQLSDSTLVPAALVETSIDDAHGDLLRFLDPVFDAPSPEEALVLGETLLAGAHLLQSLASSVAFVGRRVTVGGQRIEPDGRFEALTTLALESARRAWETLEPYLLATPPVLALLLTDSTPILGED